MKFIYSLVLLPAFASALPTDWSKKVHIQTKDAQIGTVDVSYPEFTDRVGSAAAVMNSQISKAISAMRCDPNPETSRAVDMDFEATLEVRTITKDFIALVADESYDCGGAHPDGQTETLVFDRTTGQRVDVAHELGSPVKNAPYDDPQFEVYQNKIAKFLSARLPKDTVDCLHDADPSENAADAISYWNFAVGLERGGLVFYANPPHVIAACGFELAVPYAEAQSLFEKTSFLNVWLK